MKGCATMWIRLALGIAMVGALALRSEAAGIIYDLRAMDGAGYTVGNNGKSVTAAQPAGTVKMQIWALVANANGNNADDGFRQTHLSVVSQPGTPNLRGNIVTRPDPDGVGGSQVSPDNVAPFADPLGAQPGVAVDLDADGDMDLGDLANPGITANYFIASTGVNPVSWPAVPDSGRRPVSVGGTDYSGFLIGTFDFAFTGGDVAGALSRVNAVPRNRTGPQGLLHVFRQDGANRSLAASSTDVGVGDPVMVAAIPEPSTIALLAAGLVGLVLAVRRRRA